MSGAATDRDAELRARLELCARQAAEVLRQERLDHARVASRRPVLHLALVVGAFLCALQGGAALGLWPSLPTLWVLVVGVGLPVAVYVVRIAAALGGGPGTAAALQAVDDRLALEDRLHTAWEFSARAGRGPFEEAALDDARGVLATAPVGSLEATTAADPGRPADRLRLAGAAAFVIVALLLVVPSAGTGGGPAEPGGLPAVARSTPRDEVTVKADEVQREQPAPRPSEEPTPAAGDPGERRPTGIERELADASLERGTTGRGGNSPESGSQSSSGARGHGSPRSPDPKPAQARVPERKSKKTRKERPDEARP
ncbi:MAG: hypothetical protein R3F30_03575 [Planctomycetota bacterium]